MTIASPKGYELDKETIAIADDISKGSVSLSGKPADAVRGVDVIYTDTWVSMGQEAEEKKRIKAFAGFQVNSGTCLNFPRKQRLCTVCPPIAARRLPMR